MPDSSGFSKLPSEILAMMFEFLDDGLFRPMTEGGDGCAWPMPEGDDQTGQRHRLTSVLSVSRLLKPFVENLLYRRIRINYGNFTDWARNQEAQLLQNLHFRPDLVTAIHEIKLYKASEAIDHKCAELMQILRDGSCSAKRLYLSDINPRFSDNYLPLLQSGSMPIEELDIDGHQPSLLSKNLLQLSGYKALRTLTLDLMPADVGLWCPPQRCPSIGQQSECLKSIIVRRCTFHIDYLWPLLQWPANLKNFELGMSDYNTTALRQLLYLQRQSLETIALGTFYDRSAPYPDLIPDRIPNVADFQCLRSVCVSGCNIFLDSPSNAYQKLAAPTLEHLTIKTSLRGIDVPTSETFGHFDQDSAVWLVEFVGRRHDTSPASGLRNIHINFIVLDRDRHTRAFRHRATEAEARLASISPIIASNGISITWNGLHQTTNEDIR